MHEPEPISIAAFQKLIGNTNWQDATGTEKILPGDIVTVQGGERGPLNWLIGHVQSRCLRDLDPSLSKQKADELARYTHTAVVLDAGMLIENYAPRVRCRDWSALAGKTITIHRPIHQLLPNSKILLSAITLDRYYSERVRTITGIDLARGYGYSVKDLLFFWFAWYRKTWLAKRFAEVFRERGKDFCTATVVAWWRAAGCDLFPGEQLEAVYPARILLNQNHQFDLIGHYTLEPSR